MIHVYASCGVWELVVSSGWSFNVDKKKGGRLLALELKSSLEELQKIVIEDFGFEETDADLELSYLPIGLINSSNCPPVIIGNSRQVQNFLGFCKKHQSTQLCVSYKAKQGNPNKIDIDLNKMPTDASTSEENKRNPCDIGTASNIVKGAKHNEKKKGKMKQSEVDGDDYDADKHNEKKKGKMKQDEVEGDDDDAEKINSEKENREKLAKSQVVELVKTGDLFLNKTVLKARFELCAMKHNFHYTVTNSNKSVWCIRCADKVCFWGARAECLKGSTYFIIKKYVGVHSCAPSNKTSAGRTASAKTIGNLIMHKYEGIKEGPKAKDIVQIMRNDYGCEISDSLAWDSREYAVNAVRGIPEESYGKIPKYLHMLREANPGTHSSYKTDVDGRFRYLFIAFGQSIRGFNTVMRRVIVVDGTFLKSKFKGVLLVATAIDGNSNLYPIAFGIVDSENEQSWEWFMRELKVVVADDNGLAFISDRQVSIAKALEKVYPLARHGICIHHLLNNVISYFKGKGLAGLISKASKAYRVVDFKKTFAHVCNISPAIGTYLMEADVKKWARCQFHGYRYDIRTNNPAESINSALRSPREFPVIPLLDSIREMLTRWFFKRKKLISKHTHRLTIDVEEKIDRRIGKGKTFGVYPVTDSQLLVKGDTIDSFVDLDKQTCSCGKYDLSKIPCRHAIKAGFFVGREPYTLTDFLYTTGAWREAYQESINPISVPEDGWSVPQVVENSEVLPPETRRSLGRNRKRRYETVEDKIRSSQGSQGGQSRKCSRCGLGGHNRATCKMPI
ncbi:uncharacterized protein LOC117127721 [Brassica rapa]|uniref:uncharacterized protein LOC117127721 n=1 Tax=Brassica campestris TaxID=3711 RepID=UPI00142D5FF5|nr:uncharacterized protein LOC117127721 [Brassica rapa]